MSGRLAKAGAGCFPSGRFRRPPLPSLTLFRRLADLNLLCSARLASAIVTGPVESSPLRVHSPTMQTQADNLLLVGEAAGLASPFNGGGVFSVIESGLMAAEVAAEALPDSDMSVGRRLRERYRSLSYSLSRRRDWHLRE